jgi:hypothetical protein
VHTIKYLKFANMMDTLVENHAHVGKVYFIYAKNLEGGYSSHLVTLKDIIYNTTDKFHMITFKRRNSVDLVLHDKSAMVRYISNQSKLDSFKDPIQNVLWGLRNIIE